VNANRELVALGAGNLGGGLFSAYPSGGGLSQSAVQADAGARTQLASIACAGAVALVLTALTGLLTHLAQATLGIDPGTGDLRPLAAGESSGLPAGVLVMRPRARLFFANARHVCQRVADAADAEDPPQPS
jgi:MFS superfamily sulfate permease-like transporter